MRQEAKGPVLMKSRAELKALRTTELRLKSQDAIDAEIEMRRKQRT